MWTFLVFCLSLLFSGCVTQTLSPAPSASNPSSGEKASLSDSSFELGYLRGHKLHRCVANALEGHITVKAFLDQQVLKQSSLEQPAYAALLQKVETIVTQPAAESESGAPLCRFPFKLSLRIGKDTRTASGCWSSGQGAALGSLVKEIEFSMFSEKSQTPG